MSVPTGDLNDSPGACPVVAPRAIGWIAALAVVLHVAWSLGPTLLRDDLFDGDAAQHTWWMYRFIDPTLFPNDPAAEYISQPVFVPVGYQLLFKTLVPIVDPQRLAESLAIVLSLVCAYIAWKLGQRIGCTAGAVAAIVAFCALDMPGNFIAGGFPRSFGLPMLMLGALAVMDRRWWLVGLLFLLSSLLYTPLVMNLAPLAGVMLLYSGWRNKSCSRDACVAHSGDAVTDGRRRRRSYISMGAMFALGLIALGVINTFTLRPLPESIGPFFTVEQMRAMPEWNKGGRMMLFRPWPIMYFGLSTAGIGIPIHYMPIVVGLLALTVILFRRAIPLTAWVLIGTALLVWGLAHVFLFKLYMPSRYMIYAKPVFAAMWAAGLGRDLYGVCCGGMGFQPMFLKRRTWAANPCRVGPSKSIFIASILVFGAAALVWVPGFVRQMHARPAWGPPAGYEAALDYIRETPDNTLVAAYPLDADAIPLRTRRSVLANLEMSVAMNVNYYADQKKRHATAFDLFFATDFDEVRRIAETWGVDLVLVNKTRLTHPDRWYYAPWPQRIEPLIERGEREGFALLKPPPDRIVFDEGDVIIVDVRPEPD